MDKNKAADLYFSMIKNYKLWMKQGIDKQNCYNRFVNAAAGLGELGLPNPFIEETAKNVEEVEEPKAENVNVSTGDQAATIHVDSNNQTTFLGVLPEDNNKGKRLFGKVAKHSRKDG